MIKKKFKCRILIVIMKRSVFHSLFNIPSKIAVWNFSCEQICIYTLKKYFAFFHLLSWFSCNWFTLKTHFFLYWGNCFYTSIVYKQNCLVHCAIYKTKLPALCMLSFWIVSADVYGYLKSFKFLYERVGFKQQI